MHCNNVLFSCKLCECENVRVECVVLLYYTVARLFICRLNINEKTTALAKFNVVRVSGKTNQKRRVYEEIDLS